MLILLGGPGSGKGTQSRILSKSLNVQFFSASKILKDSLKENVFLIEEINKGKCLEGKEINNIIVNFIKKNLKEGDIFEGFPRTENQVNYFIKNFSLKKLWGVVIIDIKKETLIYRIKNRYICEKCEKPYNKKESCCNRITIKRKDDINANAIEQRFNNFSKFIEKTKKKLEEKKVEIITIDGEKTLKKVEKNILDFYNKIRKKVNV